MVLVKMDFHACLCAIRNYLEKRKINSAGESHI